jgi:hypothetical protein
VLQWQQGIDHGHAAAEHPDDSSRGDANDRAHDVGAPGDDDD